MQLEVENVGGSVFGRKRHFLFSPSLDTPPMQSEASFRKQRAFEAAKANLHAWKDKDYVALNRLLRG